MGFNGVSVILPVFCRIDTPHWLSRIERAILSVLSQKCRLPIELIIIDDGSTHPIVSHESLSKLLNGNSHVRYIRLSCNHGIVFALNFGLQSAKYDLIARIDSDDAWRPGKLEKQLQQFDVDPELSIVGTGMQLVFSGRKKNEDIIRPGTWKDILRFSGEVGCPFPHGSILARKSIFNLLGGYSHEPAVSHCEDFALWTVWLRFFKGAMIEEVLYEYSISETAVSHNNARRQQLAGIKVRDQFKGLNNAEYIPEIMIEIAKFLDTTIIEAGKICFLVWRYFEVIVADVALLTCLKMLLPDRQVVNISDLNRFPFGRMFYFSTENAHPDLTRRDAINLVTLENLLENECLK